MEVTESLIDDYLHEVKEACSSNRYRVERNRNRADNNKLYREYIITKQVEKEIIMSLEVEDFSEIKPNEHKGFEYEDLYVFGKTVKLLERFGAEEKQVPLYIKINKLENGFVIFVSFHEEHHPLKYYFRR